MLRLKCVWSVMGRAGIETRTWALLVTLSWMYLGQALAGPQYMVAIPAILESGAEVKFCASLLKPNETLVMTVTLMSQDLNTTLFQKESTEEFHTCTDFLAPLVSGEVVQKFQVEVQGATFFSREVTKVLVKTNKPMSFVQTDKPIYLPGQTVNFRLVTLDTKLRPACRMYDIIELEDTSSNRIGQWVNQSSDAKILQLSYALNPEAKEGTYQIIVSFGEDKIYHNFKVEKYVLPKFDVKITSRDEVSIAQDEVTAEVCAKYTYGQPVPGTVKIYVCRPLNRYMYSLVTPGNPDSLPEVTAPCYNESKPADNNGCASFTFKMETFTKLDQKVLQDTLEIVGKVEEEGTGITHVQEKRTDVSYKLGKLSFFDTPKIYDKGANVKGKVKAVDYNDKPIADMDVYLFEGERWSSRHLQNLTTDKKGVATFSLDTSKYNGDIHLYISDTPVLDYPGYRVPFYESGDITMSMAQQSSPNSKTVSYLEVKKSEDQIECDTEQEISINYVVVKEGQGAMDLMYMVIARDGIVMQGLKSVVLDENTVNEGSVSFKLQVTAALAPVFNVVAYVVLPSSNVIAHKTEFSTEKCFSHKVDVKFSPLQGVPGEDNSLQVTGHANSICGISAIDQSVLIQEPGKNLEAEKIYNLLPINSYIPWQAQDPTECLPVRPKRSIWPYPGGDRDDAFTIFQNVGLKVATNLMIQVPNCLSYLGREFYFGNNFVRKTETFMSMAGPMEGGIGMSGSDPPPPPTPPPIQTIRTFFPETWIWDLVEIGSSGKAQLPVKVPDTITTWESEAFCLSPLGFGLAPRKKFTVFQPFFVELSLPYSIIRGESFELKATVFSYLSSCIMVAVTPAPSRDYTLTPVSGLYYTFCLCGNDRKTVRWTMAPSTLGSVNVTVTGEAVASRASCNNKVVQVPERGRIDVVTKPLIVTPEGVELSKTHNLLLCPKEETLTETIEVKLPGNVIKGSARAAVSVLGDILGRAMKNLDGLLRMPYGCGEQNMVLLAPNIYILQYLKNTQQLTPEIKEKATNYLTIGYQRQLNYKHSDGAYSTFGTGSGNTWLTAFVLRSFVKAKDFIYIDPVKIEDSKRWLEMKQRKNGCFEQVGKLFNNQMKGGVSDEVTLTAYITAALLEMDVAPDHPVVNSSLTCLKESLGDRSNTYTTALMAYVFTLAKDSKHQLQLLNHLDKVAHSDGGFLHWSQSSEDTLTSLSVEMSAYVLLATLGATPGTKELGYASRIVRWLTKQQNYYGGFSSTQDTVVALQALALYSTLVFSPEGQASVTVESPSGQLTFDVNKNNKLLYQEKTLKDMTGKYSVAVKGNTCASIQVSVVYNIPTPTDKSTFSVEVKPEADCNRNSLRPKMTLKFKSLYSGEQAVTNMAILDIKLLSGFIADSESLKALKGALLVERVEQDKDHILVYLQELSKGIAINHQLELIQELPVRNLKPAVVQLYDYYQPSDKDETEYAFPCGRGFLG